MGTPWEQLKFQHPYPFLKGKKKKLDTMGACSLMSLDTRNVNSFAYLCSLPFLARLMEGP
jgi:hypothetical protein